MQWLDDPDDYNPAATSALFDAQVTRLARRVPAVAVPGRPSGIAGVYDVTQDWIPVYDRTSLRPHTGLEVDLSHYSRLREPHASSGTVMG